MNRTLRLILAIMVGISHIGINFHGYNPGVCAVVIFYIISGYVTSAILIAPDALPANFYMERLLRLLPSYWGVAAMATLIWIFLAPQTIFLSRSPDLLDWVANLTIIPLNFFMWTEQHRFTLLPPTWSLGLELQFYIAAPWLMLRSNRAVTSGRSDLLMVVVFVLSAAFFLVATLPNVINADNFGYRVLPGVLWMFLAGAFINQRCHKLVITAFSVAALVLICILLQLTDPRPFNVETATGVVTGIPLVAVLAHLKRRAYDNFCANLAYPFFLLHFPILWVFEYAGTPVELLSSHSGLLAGWLLLNLVLSWVIFRLFEYPLNSWRHRLRNRHMPQSR